MEDIRGYTVVIMGRRARIDGPEEKVQVMRRLQTKIESPIELSADEAIVFDNIIASLPMDSWDDFRIRIAASLAQLTLYVEQLMAEVKEEGPVITNDKGTPISNPKQTAMTQTMSTLKMMSTQLGLSASQRGISEKTTGPRKKAEKEAKAALAKAAMNDLIA